MNSLLAAGVVGVGSPANSSFPGSPQDTEHIQHKLAILWHHTVTHDQKAGWLGPQSSCEACSLYHARCLSWRSGNPTAAGIVTAPHSPTVDMQKCERA